MYISSGMISSGMGENAEKRAGVFSASAAEKYERKQRMRDFCSRVRTELGKNSEADVFQQDGAGGVKEKTGGFFSGFSDSMAFRSLLRTEKMQNHPACGRGKAVFGEKICIASSIIHGV